MVRAAPKDDGEALKPLVFGLALLVAFGIATGAFAHICWVKLTPQELDAIKERGGSFRSHGGDDYATYGIEAIISHSVQHLVGAESPCPEAGQKRLRRLTASGSIVSSREA